MFDRLVVVAITIGLPEVDIIKMVAVWTSVCRRICFEWLPDVDRAPQRLTFGVEAPRPFSLAVPHAAESVNRHRPCIRGYGLLGFWLHTQFAADWLGCAYHL